MRAARHLCGESHGVNWINRLYVRVLVCTLLSPLPAALLVSAWLMQPADQPIDRESGNRGRIIAIDVKQVRAAGMLNDGTATSLIRDLVSDLSAAAKPDRSTLDASTGQDGENVVNHSAANESAARENAANEGDRTLGYLPVAQLTERPQLVRDISAEWAQHDLSPQRIVCMLLISEYGDIDRLQFDAPSLTATQQQALRERFQAARFVPGKLYGRPVRSALRIEISLD